MVEYLIQDIALKNIADAIRSKTLKTDVLTPTQMVTEILSLELAGNTEIYGVIRVSYPSGSICTCTSSDGATVLTADDDGEEYMFLIPSAGMWTVSCTDGEHSSSEDVSIVDKCQIETVVLEYMLASSILEDNSWALISNIAASGQAQNYWSVGDCKAVDIKGTVGVRTFDTTLYVYIIGFDHNGATNTIDFGTFKTAASGGKDVCLIDGKYNAYSIDGSKWFNMNHSNNTNTGGWAACDLRYDVLGSTKTKNSDAEADTAINPVSGTLMAALPSDLRAVMKPMTIYTASSGITASVDYLPLLAEFEIFGVRTHANSAEQSRQIQYAYYANGNSKVKYKYDTITSSSYWWTRSLFPSNSKMFCHVTPAGKTDANNAWLGYGLAPIFRV